MNNIEYIINWFLTNNKFINEEDNSNEKLDILTFYVIAFEKLAGLNNEDKILENNEVITIQSGPMINNEITERILKIINVEYGYYSYDVLLKTPGYRYVQLGENNGIVSLDYLKENLNDIYNQTMKQYQNYNFNKYVYKVNNKIFLSLNQLNENELLELYEINDQDQTLYEVFHDENGKMRVY